MLEINRRSCWFAIFLDEGTIGEGVAPAGTDLGRSDKNGCGGRTKNNML